MATHPTPRLVFSDFGLASLDVNASWYWDMIAYVLSQYPYLDAKGISGYTFIRPNLSVPLGGVPSSIAAFGAWFILQDTQDIADMQAVLDPILNHITDTWPEALVDNNSTAYASFYDWFSDGHYDQGEAGKNTYVGSHLVNPEVFDSVEDLKTAFKALSSLGGSDVYLVAGSGVRNARPRGGGDAVCPAWRKALVHAGRCPEVPDTRA